MDNKKVLVLTGASSGIGLITSEFFSKKGFIVYGLSRREAESKDFNWISCDVTNVSQVEDAIKTIVKKEGKIDVLINNAGFGISGSVENSSVEDVKKQFEVNFIGAVNTTKAVLPIMRKQGYGKILNTSSVASVIPIPFQSFYSASKSSLDTWAKALRIEVKPFNIQVCSVLVGDTKTGFTSVRQKTDVKKEGVYAQTVEKSVKKMEKDEQNGKDPITVAKTYFKLVKKRNIPPVKVVGFSYKFLLFIKRFVSERFMLWVVSKLYG